METVSSTIPPKTSGPAAKPRPANRWLIRIRQVHGWLGLIMSLLIAMVCLSGIYLNHKDMFDGWLRSRAEQPPPLQYASLWDRFFKSDGSTGVPEPCRFSGSLSTATAATALAGPLDRALREAKSRWGNTGLEKIEIKVERGAVVCKLTSTVKEQLAVDLASGKTTLGENKKEGKGKGGEKSEKSSTFQKRVKDFHTGKISGLTGKLVVDITSGSIVLLTLTGIYLWAWPKLRRVKSFWPSSVEFVRRRGPKHQAPVVGQ